MFLLFRPCVLPRKKTRVRIPAIGMNVFLKKGQYSNATTSGLDKIFYHGSMQLIYAYHSRLKLARVVSDHLPVISEFQLT